MTPPSTSTRTVDFRHEVASETGVEAKKPCPITGYVSAVVIHWPAGCAGLVQVAVAHLQEGAGGRATGIVPTDSGVYLALDDTTPIFNVYFPVKRGDYFMVVIRNTDMVNSHTISVDIIIVPEMKPEIKLPRPS